jgi:hypothetical protein
MKRCEGKNERKRVQTTAGPQRERERERKRKREIRKEIYIERDGEKAWENRQWEK